LAAINVVTFTPYLRAITEGVSPDFTVCVRIVIAAGIGCDSSALDGGAGASVTVGAGIDRVTDAGRSVLEVWLGGFVSVWRWVA